MFSCIGYAATAPDQPLAPFSFERRDPTPEDVEIDILYCGVCHSDLHMARNEWGVSTYPVVPGHEIVGRVKRVGSDVTRFKAGDLVGVGCMVDSCRTCSSCKEGLEQFCEAGMIGTYNAPDKHTGGMTYGGYSKSVVVYEGFVLKIADTLDPAAAAPLLCAGITTYSPLRHWKVGPGKKVGIVGLGGLGHMGLKFAHAFGAQVALFTTSPSKAEDAKRLGADTVIISTNADEMKAHAGSFDFILDCVSAPHDINAYIALLKRDGTIVSVGVPEKPFQVVTMGLVLGRRSFAGSLIGGIPETQEMLDFCAEHGITSDVEVIKIDEINTAYERMLKSDVKYRFAIDMASLAA
ncbi:NAD(P)-dependent alcohol dehydrogenase [Segnochrobactrum spirostomi]|uniref:NAD(P)-dependent alcohol dehydrogenase n=1 Tax=Segnochrobactrum spirostomi TaxID=2608987 RepID=A0A6A7Y285_9HYPH|nr:NAD(P)-dependent alcohol dehydrogenase [Segnochrobactrum spirostomi]MQT12835.1 NAD(P)-dependent alcohol dehydrogenase [Segnochrobactrum spirostomi]